MKKQTTNDWKNKIYEFCSFSEKVNGRGGLKRARIFDVEARKTGKSLCQIFTQILMVCQEALPPQQSLTNSHLVDFYFSSLILGCSI